MKLFAVSLLVTVALPGLVSGSEPSVKSSENFSLMSSMLQMGAALVLVLGLILLTYYVSTKILRKLPALRPDGRYIRIVETRPVAPRKALILVEVAGEYLLLASSEDSLVLVKQIGMLEEVEVVEESDRGASFAALLNKLKGTSAVSVTKNESV